MVSERLPVGVGLGAGAEEGVPFVVLGVSVSRGRHLDF